MHRRFEIWAIFPDGIEARVEIHGTVNSAKNAVDAMTNNVRNELAEGYGFPHGIPTYEIRCVIR